MREPAWRLFAAEFNDSHHILRSNEEKAPNYVVTPLGAKVNRLFMVGVLTDIEDVGTEGTRKRARISDPTGIHVVYAETFNPEIFSAFGDMSIPSYVAVVGKARVYEPEEGMIYLSSRAEMVKQVSVETRNYWIIEAYKSMLLRIRAMKDAIEMNKSSRRQLMELGYSSLIAEGVVEALKIYRDVDFDNYELLLKESLSFITSTEKEIKKAYIMEEEQILKIIEEKQNEEGAIWETVNEEAEKQGIEKEVMEEVIISLMEKGLIYEPQLGKLKRV